MRRHKGRVEHHRTLIPTVLYLELEEVQVQLVTVEWEK
jgi:hypothetical protein